MIKDVAIIGSGPAGLTCAIYIARAGLKPLIITGDNPGGQLVKTDIIENYPGFESIKGPDLMMKMLSQAENLGSKLIFENVENILKTKNNLFEIKLSSGEVFFSKTVLISTGATHKQLNIPGEKELTNKGVSWCATCDGPMYRNKKAVVVGGGNTAAMEALFLSNFVDEVFLIHRRDALRAEKIMQDKLFSSKKIKFIWNSELTKISGTNLVEEIEIKNNIDNSITIKKIDGIFIAIGTTPSSKFVKDLVELDDDGYIISDNTKTSCGGVFAAGDIVSGSLKQAVFAAGQGSLASKYIEDYLVLNI